MSKAIDLSEILKPYENKWVAISEDYQKILVCGKTLKEIVQKCKKIDCGNPIYFKVMPFNMSIIPFGA
ncbi:MAG: DUF5678 domain-containing protein [Candidatus Aminicenantales bacterium]